MRGRYKLAAVAAAALIAYSVFAASLPTVPPNPILIVDLPERACIGAGCLYPQTYAVVVYAPSPPGTEPFIDLEYVPPGSKALFNLPPTLYDAWARYLVGGGGPALPSIGVVVLAYTSRDIAYSIEVVVDTYSPLVPVSPGVREVIIDEGAFRYVAAAPPPIPGHGSPGNVPEGVRWGDIASVGVPSFDESPVVIRSRVGEAADSPYVSAPVELSVGGAWVKVSGTPAVVRSSRGAASISAYLGEGLYAVILTYEGLPIYVAGVIRAAYAGALAGVNATLALNVSLSAWVSGTDMIPLLYPLNPNSTLLYWVPTPLVFVGGISPSLTEGGECLEAPMSVRGGEAVIKLGQDVEGLYIGDLTAPGAPYRVSLKASLYPVRADAAVMAYSGSPVVEVGVKKGILGGLCVIGHEGGGWGGGCIGEYCPG